MAAKIDFDPIKVAYYEKAGWEAYYDRNWLRALRLMVQLNHEAFNMSWPTALTAAMDIVRASMAFAPLENNDVAQATHHLERFYSKARRSMKLNATAKELADLEIDYWIVHRELALERIQDRNRGDIEPMTQSLNRLHATLFDSTLEAMRPSAEYRSLAAKTVDRITGRYSEDVADDWQQVEQYLRQAYTAVMEARKPLLTTAIA